MKKLTGLLLSLSVIPAACDEGADVAWEGRVDTLSSGTVVVENAASRETPFWHLEDVVRIGSTHGAGADVFGRIADVELGPEQNVYVLDRQAAEVRVFDLQGDHVRTIGRKGRGPGEFQRPYSLAFDGDGRLWVADGQRYVAFDARGAVLGTYATHLRGGLGRGQVRAVDDRLLDLAMLVDRREGPDGSMQIRALGPGAVAWVLGDSALLVQSVPFGTEWRPPGLTRTRGGESLTMTVTLGPRRLFELAPQGIVWTGRSDEYAVHAVRMTGDTILTVRRRVPSVPLTREDRDRLENWLTRMREQGFTGERSVLPSSYPFFERIIAATDGTLWVYRNWAGEGAFDVFDRSGRYLAEVPAALNAGLFGTHPSISRDYVAGVWTDSLDIPYVQVQRIRRE